MAISVNPNRNNSNMRLALVKGSWSTSLRNSFRKRGGIKGSSKDSTPKKGAKENRGDAISPKEVTFDVDNLVTVIPETSEPVTDDEMTRCWCQVSSCFVGCCCHDYYFVLLHRISPRQSVMNLHHSRRIGYSQQWNISILGG